MNKETPNYIVRLGGEGFGKYDILLDIDGTIYRRLTNISRDYIQQYRAALRKYKRRKNAIPILIRDDAPYAINANTVRDCNSIGRHWSLWIPADAYNLADFWAVFDKVKEESL